MNNKGIKFLLILLIVLTIVGCKKKPEVKQPTDLFDPNVEYKSSYNGAYGNAGPLQGTTIVVSIFADDRNTEWTDSSYDSKAMTAALSRIKTAVNFLSNAAQEYGRKATFYYDWETYPDLKYRARFKEDLVTSTGENYKVQKALIENNLEVKKLKNKYHADNIIYLFFINTDFKNEVKPWTITHNNCDYCNVEFTNIYFRFSSMATPPSTYAHEMLHQYGAPDYYYANDYINQNYVDYLSKNGSKDIMFTINKGNNIDSIFTDLDAYYVGIAYRPDVANQWNLGKSEYER